MKVKEASIRYYVCIVRRKQWHYPEMKRKHPEPGFEHGSLITFLLTIPVTLILLPDKLYQTNDDKLNNMIIIFFFLIKLYTKYYKIKK